jgi:hypothetical protein
MADWHEGELEVAVAASGGREVAVSELVDVAAAKALGFLRLPRNLSRGMLERRLTQIAGLLSSQVPDLLACSDAALDRLESL